ncbi:MAG: nitrate reductase cytochrome c-type subunit [Rhodospirillales bacterium]
MFNLSALRRAAVSAAFALAAFAPAAAPVLAQDAPPVTGEPINGLRGPADLYEESQAPRMAPVEETARKRTRAYPEQPPTIPHKISGYQLDAKVNQCLSCHARARVAESNAPMVSITHFMDRDGQFLAAVSPRRYFCNQCHVVQERVEAPVKNTFIDIDSLLNTGRGQ